MRILLATIIWSIDLILKFAIGYLVVFLVWIPSGYFGGASFSLGWLIAGGFIGACINGFFEGCDLILLGWAKRISGDT